MTFPDAVQLQRLATRAFLGLVFAAAGLITLGRRLTR